MNLRKDHCRNLPSRETREQVEHSPGGTGGADASRDPPAPGACGSGPRPRLPNEPRRGRRQGKTTERAVPSGPRKRCLPRRPIRDWLRSKRLSATDISALASMKNVAKCDTWCELQNPVNHRVFERKLRPKPSGRGHVCLGVTHGCPPPTPKTPCRPSWACVEPRGEGGADDGLPRAPCLVVGPNSSPRSRHRGDRWSSIVRCPVTCVVRLSRLPQTPTRPSRALPTRPQVRRGYPLSLSISISGGKETYKDSLSNGERTGNSPG